MIPVERRRDAGFALVVALAAALIALHAAHAVGSEWTPVTLAVGVLLPAGLSVAVLIAGCYLWYASFPRLLRVALWTGVGAAVITLATVPIILYQSAHGIAMADQVFVVVDAASFGSLVGLVVGVYDARQRVAEARAASARARSERLSGQLTVLNRVLRHDLRNGANVILGHADELADGPADTAARARTIREEAADLVAMGEKARVVEDLLRGTDRELERVDLVPVLQGHLDRMRERAPSLTVDGPAVEECTVVAHPHVDRALFDVIENAVEHNGSPDPHVAVTVRIEGDEVVVEVADNGPGIPESEVRALERGYETSLEHTSGLGLWLVDWIVTESGGSLTLETGEPAGSVVRLRFRRPAGA